MCGCRATAVRRSLHSLQSYNYFFTFTLDLQVELLSLCDIHSTHGALLELVGALRAHSVSTVEHHILFILKANVTRRLVHFFDRDRRGDRCDNALLLFLLFFRGEIAVGGSECKTCHGYRSNQVAQAAGASDEGIFLLLPLRHLKFYPTDPPR